MMARSGLPEQNRRTEMVWGLKLPSEFGAFFPNGDFIGYREQLNDALHAMTPEEKAYYNNRETSYRLHVSQCFKYEHGTMHGEGRVFRPVAEHEWPREFRTMRQYAKLGSLVTVTNSLLLIDEPLKNIIEGLEPGVHQFRPIRMTYKQGEAYATPYFTMVIGRFLTSFDPDQSERRAWSHSSRSYNITYFNKENASGLAMTTSVFDGCHLWRERRLLCPEIYFSDALQAEIKKAGLHMPKHYRMKEV
jgi:hypothetical protein